jgi:hypothetical protein
LENTLRIPVFYCSTDAENTQRVKSYIKQLYRSILVDAVPCPHCCSGKPDFPESMARIFLSAEPSHQYSDQKPRYILFLHNISSIGKSSIIKVPCPVHVHACGQAVCVFVDPFLMITGKMIPFQKLVGHRA